jgi:cell wall-active antibiotic response 4TMS protein YvqF
MFLMAAGALMVIDRMDLAEVRLTAYMWPFIPLALGLVRVIDPAIRPDGRVSSPRSGVWLVLLGCWGLANEYQLYGLDYQNSWPLLIVLAGLNIVWRSVEGAPRPAPDRGQPS